MDPTRTNQCSNNFSYQQIPLIFGFFELKRACIPGAVYTSAPAYLPDPLFDFFEGLVPTLLLQRLQHILSHLVLIEQAVSRLFSICKCCGKGNCEKAAVSSRGDHQRRGGNRYSCEIWSWETDYSAVDSPGEPLQGGTVHTVTALPWTLSLHL